MIISHKYKFIFIHITKCAGTSITHAISPYLGEEDIILGATKEGEKLSEEWRKTNGLHKHAKAQEIRKVLGDEIWNNYFKFTFVRNPWDMLVSTYHWWLTTSWDDQWNTGQKIKAMKDFGEYVYSPQCRTEGCWDFVVDEEGEIILDFIGKQERMTRDFAFVCGRTGLPNIKLPRKNASQHDEYTKYYTEEIIELVGKKFAADIQLFKYSFGEKSVPPLIAAAK